jgi:small subunit ribosomal protein S9
MVEKFAHKPGKRKRSIARATVKEGKGRVTVNSVPLEVHMPEMARFKIQEALLFAGDIVDLSKVDVSVNVAGGGVMGQADAARSSIARCLVKFTGSDELLDAYLARDRTMIAGDHRLTETHKPSQSSKGPRHKRQKSYR